MTEARFAPKPAVSAIIVEGNAILLIKRGCQPNKGLWSLPGGSIEAGETMRDAVAREVLEETSLVVDVGDVAGVQEIISREDDSVLYHYVIVNLFAKVVSGDIAASDDAAEVRWVPLPKVKEYPTTNGLVERLKRAGVNV